MKKSTDDEFEFMTDGGIIDPYSEKKMNSGTDIVCRKTINGITVCRKKDQKKKSYNLRTLCMLLLVSVCIVLFFSVRISIYTA